MSTRQYIGARYVPKFYTNSVDGSSLWESNVVYDPLTYVTLSNAHMYISKKQIPATVGTPASNAEYWLDVGSYNGFIDDLQNQINDINDVTIPALESDIDDLEDRVDHLNDRTFVIITDSYGSYQNTNNRNFYEEAMYKLGISDYYGFYRGSAGFCRTSPLNFLDVLQDNEASIADKTAITDIIVCGGANDQVAPDDVSAGMVTFINYVRTNYPNAKIHVGFFTESIAPDLIGNFSKAVENYKTTCINKGINYITNSEFIMRKISFYENDNVHPSLYGITALSKYFAQFIATGAIDVWERASSTIVSNDADFTISANADHLVQVQHNDQIEITNYSGGSMLTFTSANGFTLSAGQTNLLSKFKFIDGFLYDPLNFFTNMFGTFESGGKYANVRVTIDKIAANKVATFGFLIFASEAITVSAGGSIGIGIPTMSVPVPHYTG